MHEGPPESVNITHRATLVSWALKNMTMGCMLEKCARRLKIQTDLLAYHCCILCNILNHESIIVQICI